MVASAHTPRNRQLPGGRNSSQRRGYPHGRAASLSHADDPRGDE